MWEGRGNMENYSLFTISTYSFCNSETYMSINSATKSTHYVHVFYASTTETQVHQSHFTVFNYCWVIILVVTLWFCDLSLSRNKYKMILLYFMYTVPYFIRVFSIKYWWIKFVSFLLCAATVEYCVPFSRGIIIQYSESHTLFSEHFTALRQPSLYLWCNISAGHVRNN